MIKARTRCKHLKPETWDPGKGKRERERKMPQAIFIYLLSVMLQEPSITSPSSSGPHLFYLSSQ